MKTRIYILIYLLLLLSSFAEAQVNNPCKGDIVGKRAGSGTYNVPRDCDIIIMSLGTYDSLKLQEKKLQTEIGLLDEQIVLEKQAVKLREEVISRKDSIIKVQDNAIAEYRDIADQAIKRGEECTKNTDRCLEELKEERRKTKLFTILGAAGGFLVGLVTGILLG